MQIEEKQIVINGQNITLRSPGTVSYTHLTLPTTSRV